MKYEINNIYDLLSATFNRTIIELKLSGLRAAKAGEGAFNRTIIELKFVDYSDLDENGYTFNRTIIELK